MLIRYEDKVDIITPTNILFIGVANFNVVMIMNHHESSSSSSSSSS